MSVITKNINHLVLTVNKCIIKVSKLLFYLVRDTVDKLGKIILYSSANFLRLFC